MPSISSDDGRPVIPNMLYPLKACHYRPSKGAWRHVSSRKSSGETHHPSSIRIVTWNVDFQKECVLDRLSSALRHLETDIFKCKDGEAPEPCCIMLQEVHGDALPHILADEWVRDHFIVTPISKEKWPEGQVYYGNVTLVTRSLTVVCAQVLHLGSTEMSRTGVMVDIILSTPSAAANSRTVTIRLINTHLESLPRGAWARPVQLSALASFLSDEDVQGGVIAGDMNALGPSDVTIAAEVGLRDAWKRGDQDETGFTWGYQGGGDFPAARLDKILFLPRRGYRVDEPSRVGMGLKTTGSDGSFTIWTSDHYGLETVLRVLR